MTLGNLRLQEDEGEEDCGYGNPPVGSCKSLTYLICRIFPD